MGYVIQAPLLGKLTWYTVMESGVCNLFEDLGTRFSNQLQWLDLKKKGTRVIIPPMATRVTCPINESKFNWVKQ